MGLRYREAIAKRDDCVVVAYCPRLPPDLVDQRRGHPTWQAVLDDGDFDGVIVATTPQNQVEVALAAARKGLPVLVEKPLGLSAEDVFSVQAAMTPESLVLVDLIHLWSPAYRKLVARAKALHAGGFRVMSIETEGSNSGPFRSFSPFYDYAPHDLAMVLNLLGPWERVKLMGKARLTGERRGFLYLSDFKVGSVDVVMKVGNGSPSKRRLFEVKMGLGKRRIHLCYDDTKRPDEKVTEDGTPLKYDWELPLDLLLTDFVGAIRQKLPLSNIVLSAKIAEAMELLCPTERSPDASRGV